MTDEERKIMIDRIIEKVKKLKEIRSRKQDIIPAPLSRSDNPKIFPAR